MKTGRKLRNLSKTQTYQLSLEKKKTHLKVAEEVRRIVRLDGFTFLKANTSTRSFPLRDGAGIHAFSLQPAAARSRLVTALLCIVCSH